MENKTQVVKPENDIDGVKLKSFADLNVKSPEPGIYTGIPFEQYFDINALNSSKIRKACESLLVYRRYMLEQEGKKFETTYALEFGRAFALM